MTARGTANLLTRTTALLAAAFFVTSIVLAILANNTTSAPSIVDEVLEETSKIPAIPTVPTDQ
jgi:preprotein translocase subunit SecG